MARAVLRFAGAAELVCETLPQTFVLDPAQRREVVVGREGLSPRCACVLQGRHRAVWGKRGKMCVCVCVVRACARSCVHVCDTCAVLNPVRLAPHMGGTMICVVCSAARWVSPRQQQAELDDQPTARKACARGRG